MCPRMPSTNAVLVLVVRSRDGGLARCCAELLTAARSIGVPVAAVSGPADTQWCAGLERFGVRRVLRAAGESALDVLAAAVRLVRPELVLLPGNEEHNELALRLSVRLEAGIVTNAVALERAADGIRVRQAASAGRLQVQSVITKAPAIVAVRPGAFPAEPDPAPATAPPVEDLCVTEATPIRVPRFVRSTPVHPLDRKLLSEAVVVVVGGRGVGSAGGFALLAEVARELDGCLGATHTAGELGWAPDHARVNLPGTQIRPRLYLGCGVSGSLRHRAAIRGAHTVVAIDRDPRAPLVREADVAVIGDLHSVLPALLAELRRRGSARSRSTDPSEPVEA